MRKYKIPARITPSFWMLFDDRNEIYAIGDFKGRIFATKEDAKIYYRYTTNKDWRSANIVKYEFSTKREMIQKINELLVS